MILMFWYLIGIPGSLLIWRSFKLIDKKYDEDFTWCPSPMGVLSLIVGSWLGPLILIAGLAVTIEDGLSGYGYKKSWLFRPICRKQIDD